MIKKFKTILSMAVFQNFTWDSHVKLPGGTIDTFKKINIFYGRNYSGKTTLSRIIRALETGAISEKYSNPQFSVLWDDQVESTHNILTANEKTIRVFNEDFVRANLSFLTDSDNGKIIPFAVIGADNVNIKSKIRELEAKIGNEESGNETELYAKLNECRQKKADAQNNFDSAKRALESKMTQKATGNPSGIKYKFEGHQTYDKRKLEADITAVYDASYTPVDEAKRQELELSLTETAKNSIPKVEGEKPELQSICNQVRAVVEKRIGGSEKIQELLRDHVLSEWVKEGCEIHTGDSGKRSDCAFCGNKISSERWQELEKHFDEESRELEKQIIILKELIEKKKRYFLEESPVSKEAFYSTFHSTIDGLLQQYKSVSTAYCGQLDELKAQLDKRKKSLVQDFEFAQPTCSEPNFTEIYKNFNAIIDEANAYTASLSNAKQEALKILRLNEVWKFVQDIDYAGEKKRIKSLDEVNCNAGEDFNTVSKKIKDIKENIEFLKRQMNDEEKGADKVNEYLKHFGHESLSLKARSEDNPEGKRIHFDVVRGEQKAFHLSEGECSLIAFCYFMAKLDDVATNDKKVIIWIDDPISSLDSNHVFFVYSLLRSEIVDKGRFEQLFVSTHNLEFLKYLKRLTGTDAEGKDYQKCWLLVERSFSNSIIKPMPKYLKNYITEFNYLFEQIWKCAEIDEITDDNYHSFYNLGNNCRKFLEIYLSYKYPHLSTYGDRKPEIDEAMKNFFDGSPPKYFVDRINNEYSHLSGTFERGSMPIDVPEMQLAARHICKRLKMIDREQYDSLVRSVAGVCEND